MIIDSKFASESPRTNYGIRIFNDAPDGPEPYYQTDRFNGPVIPTAKTTKEMQAVEARILDIIKTYEANDLACVNHKSEYGYNITGALMTSTEFIKGLIRYYDAITKDGLEYSPEVLLKAIKTRVLNDDFRVEAQYVAPLCRLLKINDSALRDVVVNDILINQRFSFYNLQDPKSAYSAIGEVLPKLKVEHQIALVKSISEACDSSRDKEWQKYSVVSFAQNISADTVRTLEKIILKFDKKENFEFLIRVLCRQDKVDVTETLSKLYGNRQQSEQSLLDSFNYLSKRGAVPVDKKDGSPVPLSNLVETHSSASDVRTSLPRSPNKEMKAYNLEQADSLKQQLEIWLTNPKSGEKLEQAKFRRIFDDGSSAEQVTLKREAENRISVRTQKIIFGSDKALLEYRDLTEFISAKGYKEEEALCFVCRKESGAWKVQRNIQRFDNFGGSDYMSRDFDLFGANQLLQQNFEPAPNDWDFHNLLSVPTVTAYRLYSRNPDADKLIKEKNLKNLAQNSTELYTFLKDAKFYFPEVDSKQSFMGSLANRILKNFSYSLSFGKRVYEAESLSSDLLKEGHLILAQLSDVRLPPPLLWPQRLVRYDDGSLRPDIVSLKTIDRKSYLTTDKEGRFYVYSFNFYPNREVVPFEVREIDSDQSKDFVSRISDCLPDTPLPVVVSSIRKWLDYMQEKALGHLLDQGQLIGMTPDSVLWQKPEEWIGLAHQLHMSGKFVSK